jgi:hypothetical protein
MILMLDFNPVQLVVRRQGRDHLRGEILLRSSSPRMGEHSNTTGIVDEVNAFL